jgi:SAM-dependent methyltransferase
MTINRKRAASMWDERARQSNHYKDEEFYTITPLPYYIKRRGIMLALAEKYVNKADSIMDYGCGDGWYLEYFAKIKIHSANTVFSGLDLSSEMVKKARSVNPKANIYVSQSGIRQGEQYELVYTFATLAHIAGDTIISTFENIEKSLIKGGKFMLFEQTASNEYVGKNFIRRSIQDYINLGQASGLKLEKTYLIRFSSHAFFERYIAKKYVKWCKGNNEFEKRLNANSHKFYRFMSRMFLFFDRRPVKNNARCGWGNVLIIFEKVK